jgi:hypothetical protein
VSGRGSLENVEKGVSLYISIVSSGPRTLSSGKPGPTKEITINQRRCLNFECMFLKTLVVPYTKGRTIEVLRQEEVKSGKSRITIRSKVPVFATDIMSRPLFSNF